MRVVIERNIKKGLNRHIRMADLDDIIDVIQNGNIAFEIMILVDITFRVDAGKGSAMRIVFTIGKLNADSLEIGP